MVGPVLSLSLSFCVGVNGGEEEMKEGMSNQVFFIRFVLKQDVRPNRQVSGKE